MTLLTKTMPSLPGSWYFDPDHYTRELNAIWYRDWVCVGRLEEIPRAGDYRTITVGDQRLIILRHRDGEVRAFHNTCRHRGSVLCTRERGRFRNERIICPYHTWSYSLAGELVATPHRVEVDDFDMTSYSLYAVHVKDWGGYMFVNLSDEPVQSLSEFLGPEVRELDQWPLATLRSVHQERSTLACNWKIFWENYSECYHCPRVHPELCRIVPVYRKGLLNDSDDPAWQPTFEGDDGRPRIAASGKTWTFDGQSPLPPIDGLTDAQRSVGMTFASLTASMYIVAHPDYVRSVRLLPAGPESVELVIDWLLLPDVRDKHADELEEIFRFGRLVVQQDGLVCESNQKGLHSNRHDHGVLVPQEHSLWAFHEWLRGRLAQFAA